MRYIVHAGINYGTDSVSTRPQGLHGRLTVGPSRAMRYFNLSARALTPRMDIWYLTMCLSGASTAAWLRNVAATDLRLD